MEQDSEINSDGRLDIRIKSALIKITDIFRRWGFPLGIILLIVLVVLSLITGNLTWPSFPQYLLLAFPPMIPYLILVVFRWRYYLVSFGLEASYKDAFNGIIKTIAFGSLTPVRVGDVGRISFLDEEKRARGFVAFLTEKGIEICSLAYSSATLMLLLHELSEAWLNYILIFIACGAFIGQFPIAVIFMKGIPRIRIAKTLVVSFLVSFGLIITGGLQYSAVFLGFFNHNTHILVIGSISVIGQIIAILSFIPMGIGVKEGVTAFLMSLVIIIDPLEFVGPLLVQRIIFLTSIIMIALTSTAITKHWSQSKPPIEEGDEQ